MQQVFFKIESKFRFKRLKKPTIHKEQDFFMMIRFFCLDQLKWHLIHFEFKSNYSMRMNKRKRFSFLFSTIDSLESIDLNLYRYETNYQIDSD